MMSESFKKKKLKIAVTDLQKKLKLKGNFWPTDFLEVKALKLEHCMLY